MSDSVRQPPELLRELTPQQWAAWKRHPITELVFERYLPDFRTRLGEETLAAWIDGRMQLVHEQQARGHMMGSLAMEALTLGVIRVFYGLD